MSRVCIHTHTHSAVMLHMKGVSNGILVRPVWPCCTKLRSLIPYQELREREREFGGEGEHNWMDEKEENKGRWREKDGQEKERGCFEQIVI